jgi:hypothetical protein
MILTRPYEGLWFCAAPVVAICGGFLHWKKTAGAGKNIMTSALVALTPVAAALAFLLIYNHAVTGDALKFPHLLYQEQQMPDVGVFVWDHPSPAPLSRNPEISYQLRRFNPEVIFTPKINFGELFRAHISLLTTRISGFFFQGILGLGATWAILSGQLWRQIPGRLALGCFVSFLGMLLTLRFFGFPHYAAAWTAPLAALIILGFRHLALLPWRGQSCAALMIALTALGWALGTLAIQTARGNPPQLWAVTRWEVTTRLEAQAARDHQGQVVFVLMAQGQPAFAEWVYNSADINAQTVIFSRSLGPENDIQVAQYFPERKLWLAWLKPDGELDRLAPYDPVKKSAPPATKG